MKILGTLTACLLLLVSYGTAIADPVLWETNGHYYEAIAIPSGITWVDANIDATNSSYLGMGGHLATVTSEEENSFILTTFGSNNIVGFLLGGFQTLGSSEPSGGWTWVTGEEWNAWDVSNWKGGEPNNTYSGGAIFYYGTSTSEEVLQYSNHGGIYASQFNDVPDMSGWGGYIVEYEPSAPIDEPILEMDALYDGGTLSLDFLLGTPEPAVWGTYLIFFGHTPTVVPLWKAPIPQIAPAIDIPIDFPCPHLGLVLFYTCLYDRGGVQIKDFGWVDTGLPD